MEPERDDGTEDVWDALDRLEGKLDHLHDDLVALREWCRIPRPACYGAPPVEEGRAERAQEG